MTRSAVAYWVSQFQTSQANLATRTSERDASRNAQYVSGTYQSGPTWQAQDATDVAAGNAALAAETAAFNASQASLAAETTLFNNQVAATAAITPAALDTIAGSVIATSFSSGTSETTMMRLTVDRSGFWAAAAFGTGNGNDSGSHIDCHIYYNGVSQAVGTSQWNGNTPAWGAVMSAPVFISAGQTIEVRIDKTGGATCNVAAQSLFAYFVPTPGNPH